MTASQCGRSRRDLWERYSGESRISQFQDLLDPHSSAQRVLLRSPGGRVHPPNRDPRTLTAAIPELFSINFSLHRIFIKILFY